MNTSSSQRHARKSLRRASMFLQRGELRAEQRKGQRKRVSTRVNFESPAEVHCTPSFDAKRFHSLQFVCIKALPGMREGHVRMPSDTRPSRLSPSDMPLRLCPASYSTQKRVARESCSDVFDVCSLLFFVSFICAFCTDGEGNDAETTEKTTAGEKTNVIDQK